ncbi:MAG: methyltransferase domain-containing protein [Bacteroidia bacterium]|nr:methyltransferase domain-containing protein [Bacteroidia bacterium]
MTNIYTCPLTGSTDCVELYQQNPVPVFQNKVFLTREAALDMTLAPVTLVQSLASGFVFNGTFGSVDMNYDSDYQNEQGNSEYFQQHLKSVIDLLDNKELLTGKIIEIGCGKGYFLTILKQRNKNVTGFDPAYEGTDKAIIKDYYSSKYSNLKADLIVLRHTLEHIPKPLEFIQQIATANQRRGKIYIEVPTFDWISEHQAVEDIFYEHCNYFTMDTLKLIFHKSFCEHVFNGQYLALIADLKDVKEEIDRNKFLPMKINFRSKINEYSQLVSTERNLAIWGGGAKGSTFVNLVDKNREKIKCVIDINKKKQHCYVGGTGHLIVPPSEIKSLDVKTILVMNSNYLSEIKNIINGLSVNIISIN